MAACVLLTSMVDTAAMAVSAIMKGVIAIRGTAMLGNIFGLMEL